MRQTDAHQSPANGILEGHRSSVEFHPVRVFDYLFPDKVPGTSVLEDARDQCLGLPPEDHAAQIENDVQKSLRGKGSFHGDRVTRRPGPALEPDG